jgi:hypothetical protein
MTRRRARSSASPVVGLDSYKQDLIANDDGTVDVYFAADPPTGQDGNWIKTRSGEPFFVMFRVYGPKKEAVDGSWMLNDVEKVQNEHSALRVR